MDMKARPQPYLALYLVIGGLIALLGWGFWAEPKSAAAVAENIHSGDAEPQAVQPAIPEVSNGDSNSRKRLPDPGLAQPGQASSSQIEGIIPGPDSVVVFVHDSDGQALADFPMSLELEHNQWNSTNVSTNSDADGYAYFKQVQEKFTAGRSFVRLKIRAAPTFKQAPEYSFAPSEWPTKVVDYQVPAFGSVRMVLQGYEGEPYLKSTPCFIQRHEVDTGFYRQVHGLNPVPARDPMQQRSTDGVAIFSFVGLGLELEGGALLDASNRPYETYFQGPVKQGEQVEAVVWADHVRPSVRFRVLDETGEPIRDQRIDSLTTYASGGSNTRGYADLRSNAEGLVSYIVTTPVGPDAPGVMTLNLSCKQNDQELVSDLVLPTNLSEGVNDLGDVILSGLPILISGRVLDAQGAPAPGVRLHVMAEFSNEDYREIGGGTHRTDSEGQFLIRGRSEAPKIVFYTGATNNLDVETRVDPGTTGIEVRLNPVYSVSGSLLLDEKILPTSILLRTGPLDYAAEQGIPFGAPRAQAQADGSFVLKVADSSPVSLLITDRVSGAMLKVIPQITPSSDPEFVDPQLNQIDLRGQLYQYYLSFVDSEGQLVKNVRMVIEGCPTFAMGSHNPGTYLFEGKGNLILPLQSFHFEATGPGQRLMTGDVPGPGERTFEMKSGILGQVQIMPGNALPKGAHAILKLVTVDGQDFNASEWNRTADADGLFQFTAPAAGRYRANLLIYPRDSIGDGARRYFPPDDQAPVLEILDIHSLQIFELRVDAAAIAEFLNQ
jgi:hypothetical protein